MKPWLKILIGLVLGIITGLILNKQVEILALCGKAFIDLLKMLVGLVTILKIILSVTEDLKRIF